MHPKSCIVACSALIEANGQCLGIEPTNVRVNLNWNLNWPLETETHVVQYFSRCIGQLEQIEGPELGTSGIFLYFH